MIELWLNRSAMLKTKAIELLGGTAAAAADALGVTYQAIVKWPPVLPDRIAERVVGVIALRRYPDLAAEVATGAEVKC